MTTVRDDSFALGDPAQTDAHQTRTHHDDSRPAVASTDQASSDDGFDREVDLLVLGSGGGGMATAITAASRGFDVLVVEKAKTFGGSTTLSGGGIWIPNNPTLVRQGLGDDRASVLQYLRAITAGEVPQARLEAFVDNGPALMSLLEASPHVKFYWVPGYSDYHPELPGGRPDGRTVEATPYDTRALGAAEAHQPRNSMQGPMGLWVTSKDYHDLAMVKRTWAGRRAALVAAWRVVSNFFRRRHMASGGRALMARLRMVMKDLDIPLWLASPAEELIVVDGHVVGAVVHHDDADLRVRARHGVVLATGGFDHDQAMRDQWLPEGGATNFSAGARSNTGDGHRMAAGVDAELGLMDDAWWMPSVRHPKGWIIPLVSERAIPRQIIVGPDGHRFTNEAAPYVNFVHDQLAGDHLPAWCIMDATARSRYPFAQVLPGVAFPDSWYQAGIVHKSNTIAGLAESIGIPGDVLVNTVARFNGFAASSVDDDFGRGNSAYDRYYGDPTLPNPNLDTIVDAPYYAVRIEAGDLGTKGGATTDEHARVLRADGSVVAGLYATGNTSASVMGRDYAGAGATIGPALVFGHIAANHAVDGANQTETNSHVETAPRIGESDSAVPTS